LLEALKAAGYNVQLKHLPEEEDKETNGDVELLSADGTSLSKQAMYQHNRNMQARAAYNDTLLAALKK